MASTKATAGALGKQNIREFGKTFAYLKNPTLRAKETGDVLLTINNAEFSGVSFQGLTWKDIRFVNCDFLGTYEIKLERLEKSTFEDCKFAGIHNFGDMVDVRLFRCGVGGESYLMGDVESKGLVFEECNFIGTDSDRNHWGAVGGYGEAEFVRCKAKWFDLSGCIKLTISDCEFEDVSSKNDPREVGNRYAPMLIHRSKLHGKFDMVATSLQSLTIRDTNMDNLDLSNATFKGDVTMERVRGGVIRAGVKSARSFTLTNSEILGTGGVTFEMAMDSAQQVLLENVNFGTGLTTKVNLGPGRALKPNEWSASPTNQQAVLRGCTFPSVDASWLETKQLLCQGNTIGRLNLSNGRIGKLELTGNAIGRGVDFTNTQVKESKVQALAKGQAKLGGSNIKA